MFTRTAILCVLLAWLQALTRWLFPSNGEQKHIEELTSSVAYKGSRPNPPSAVAVVWAEDKLKDSAIKQLIDIIKWCDHENMQTVCVYDPSGGLKSLSNQLQHELIDQSWFVQIGWRNAPIGRELVCESCSAQRGLAVAAEAGAHGWHPRAAGTLAREQPLPSAPREAAEAAMAAPPRGAELAAAPCSARQLPAAATPPCYGVSAAPSARAPSGRSSTQSAAAEARATATPKAAVSAALGLSAAAPAVAAAKTAAAPPCGGNGRPLAHVSCSQASDCGSGGAACSLSLPLPLAAAEGCGQLPGGGGDGGSESLTATVAAAAATETRPPRELLGSATAAVTDTGLDVEVDVVTAVTVAGAAGAEASRAGEVCAPCGRGGCSSDTADIATGSPGAAYTAAVTATAVARRCCFPANQLQPRAGLCACHSPPGQGADHGKVAEEGGAAQHRANGPQAAAAGSGGDPASDHADRKGAGSGTPDMRGAGSSGGGGGVGVHRDRWLHVLSAEDGYAPVLRAAAAGGTCSRCGAVAALKGGPYREGLARLRKQMAQLAGPSALVQPELVLVVGPALTLAGFPPLSVAASEILHLGPASGLCRERVDEALAKFLRTEQRFGS